MKAPGSWHVPLRHQISSIQHLPVTLQLLPVPTMLPFTSHIQPCTHKTRVSFPAPTPTLTSLLNSLIKVMSVLNATEQDPTRPYFPCLWCSGCSHAFLDSFFWSSAPPQTSPRLLVLLSWAPSPATTLRAPQQTVLSFTSTCPSNSCPAPPKSSVPTIPQLLPWPGSLVTTSSSVWEVTARTPPGEGALLPSFAMPWHLTAPPALRQSHFPSQNPRQQVLFSSCRPSSFSFKTTPLFVPRLLHYSFIFLFCCLLIF